MGQVTVHTGAWTLDDRAASQWHYLPVEVAPGTAALRVELEYERSAAVLDLGCLDPAGFRGWSGGARESFVITEDDATPGYLPGRVEPGLWQVIIGLHLVPADGVRYRVTVEPSNGRTAGHTAVCAPPAPGSRPARRELPATAGRRWLAGDLHSHTVHSDGALSVPELACLAISRGLEFIAVTDHNTISHHGELAAASRAYAITLIPGQEVTTPHGHAGVLGDTGWIDFRDTPDDWLDAAERGGGLMAVNHPIAGPVSWLHQMRRRPPLVEVWHWSWLDLTWTTPLAWWQAWDPATIPVGGSDWHRQGSDAPPGTPTTWVESAGDDTIAILDALRSGRVAITAERDGPVLLRRGGDLVAIDADGLVLAGPAGMYRRIRGDHATMPGRQGYHRLLTPAGKTMALSP